MMDCDIIRDLLPLYADGLASEASSTAIAEHTRFCIPCRRLRDEMCASLEPKEQSFHDLLQPHRRSRLLYAAIALFALAFLAGIPSIGLLFSQDYAAHLTQDIISSGIRMESSVQGWYLIGRCAVIFTCLTSCLMAVCLVIARRRPYRGYNALSTVAQWLIYIFTACGIFCAVLFAFRFIRSAYGSLQKPAGIIAFYAMFLMEGLMLFQAVLLFIMIRKFLNSCIDSATSIGYTLETSKLDNRSIPAFCATGFLVLAIVAFCMAIERMVTVSLVINTAESYYKLIISRHPGQIAEALCFIFSSAGNFLISRCLQNYKRFTELALFDARNNAA